MALSGNYRLVVSAILLRSVAVLPLSGDLGTLKSRSACQFALCIEEGTDFDDVESVLFAPGGHFQRNRNGAVVNIRRTDLTPLAKYWMKFSHANIQPCSHVSNITVSKELLLYCMLRNMSINIGQVIANEIQSIHRGQVAAAEMIIGMYDTPPVHMWTMEEDEDDYDYDVFEDAEDNEEEEDIDDNTA
ncbi:hypothetical protein LR48_Vigan07g173300 [Vigna angularis]|uniref:Putative plant transposon protein domain-containing protein n=1 Tax=Phaseolus angularis TaxID=3914 RepID=A0A0L9UZS8_PHAAN|nr:hypothetical protein LR48_Vigan07g173300 [Vigna angularis]